MPRFLGREYILEKAILLQSSSTKFLIRLNSTGQWKLPLFSARSTQEVLSDPGLEYSNCFYRVVGFDNVKQCQILSFIVHKPTTNSSRRAENLNWGEVDHSTFPISFISQSCNLINLSDRFMSYYIPLFGQTRSSHYQNFSIFLVCECLWFWEFTVVKVRESHFNVS